MQIPGHEERTSCPPSPTTEHQISGDSVPPSRRSATSTSSTINNNNPKYNDSNDDRLVHSKKFHHRGGSGEGYKDGGYGCGNFSDYALLRKLFPHHDKSYLLDALLSCDGSTVAAIQHLLTNTMGATNNAAKLQHQDMTNNSSLFSERSPLNNSRKLQKRESPLDTPPLNSIPNRGTLGQQCLEPNTPPPPPPSLSMHGGSSNQIQELPPTVLPQTSPTHHLPHVPSHPNFNFPAAKFSSYAAAQAQQFYAHAHHRYLAAAAAAAASAMQQGHPHTTGHQMNNTQGHFALPPNLGGAASGLFPGNLLNRPDFAQYLNNAAAQHNLSSSGRIGSTVGMGSSNSNHSALGTPNLLLNQHAAIPPLFQHSQNSGNLK